MTRRALSSWGRGLGEKTKPKQNKKTKKPTVVSLMNLEVTWINHQGQASVLNGKEETIFVSFLRWVQNI